MELLLLLLLLLLMLLMLLLVRRPVASRWTKAAWENFLKKMPLVTNGMMRGGGCFGAVAAAASKRHSLLCTHDAGKVYWPLRP
jgi:hypothetical protein